MDVSERDILVGFRFFPTDQEIIRLLGEKRRDPSVTLHAFVETNIYDFEPPELFGLSPIQSDKEWCSFLCAPKYKNTGRKRMWRATKTGYWKVTGEGYPIMDKRSKRKIGFKRVLVFHLRPGGGKEIKTDWVMHQFSATDNPLYKRDFVVCRVKKQRNKKRHTSTDVGGQQRKKLCLSTNSQSQPSNDMAFDNENTSPELQLPENASPELQLPFVGNTSSGLQLPFVGKILPENASPELQLPFVGNTSPGLQLPFVGKILPENASPGLQLPFVGKTSPELQLPFVGNTSPELQSPVAEYASPELQLSAVENTSPELEIPFIGNTFPQFQLSIAENTSLKPQQLPSDCSVYSTGHEAAANTLQVDSPPLATFNAPNGCNELVQSSPINPEQESSSSGVSTNDYNGLDSPYRIVWVEDIPLDVQDEYTSEEGRDSTLPYFKSSISIPGFCGGNRSETDTEFTEWLHNMFKYDNMASVNYNAILNY